MKRIKITPIVLIVMTIIQASVRTQSYTSLGMEGGSGFIYTKLTNTNAKGFLGLTLYGIYSLVSLPRSRESPISAVSAFTYSATDNLEFAMVFYAVGRGVIADESISNTRIESGLGESQFALRYRLPLRLASADLAGRVAFHVPMGINFASHPSYPYDTDVYSLFEDQGQELEDFLWRYPWFEFFEMI